MNTFGSIVYVQKRAALCTPEILYRTLRLPGSEGRKQRPPTIGVIVLVSGISELFSDLHSDMETSKLN